MCIDRAQAHFCALLRQQTLQIQIVLGYQVLNTAVFTRLFDCFALKRCIYSVLRTRTFQRGRYLLSFCSIATQFSESKICKHTVIYRVWRLGACQKKSPKPAAKGPNSAPFQIHDFLSMFTLCLAICSTLLCGKKSISPTQFKDFDALLLLPIFESLKI